jgi:hypothetical protein
MASGLAKLLQDTSHDCVFSVRHACSGIRAPCDSLLSLRALLHSGGYVGCGTNLIRVRLANCAQLGRRRFLCALVGDRYTPTMIHPLHRATPYQGDPSIFTDEQRFLMHEARPAKDWVYGSARDKVRLDRYRRTCMEGADYYQRELAQEMASGK